MALNHLVALDVLMNEKVPFLEEKLLQIVDVRKFIDSAPFQLSLKVAGLIFAVDILTRCAHLFEYVIRVIVGDFLLYLIFFGELTENSVTDALHSIFPILNSVIKIGLFLTNESVHRRYFLLQVDDDTLPFHIILLDCDQIPMSELQMTDKLQSFLELETFAERTWVIFVHSSILIILIDEES